MHSLTYQEYPQQFRGDDETFGKSNGYFWPGVNAVKTTSYDPVLENAEFVYLTARDCSDALAQFNADERKHPVFS